MPTGPVQRTAKLTRCGINGEAPSDVGVNALPDLSRPKLPTPISEGTRRLAREVKADLGWFIYPKEVKEFSSIVLVLVLDFDRYWLGERKAA